MPLSVELNLPSTDTEVVDSAQVYLNKNMAAHNFADNSDLQSCSAKQGLTQLVKQNIFKSCQSYVFATKWNIVQYQEGQWQSLWLCVIPHLLYTHRITNTVSHKNVKLLLR